MSNPVCVPRLPTGLASQLNSTALPLGLAVVDEAGVLRVGDGKTVGGRSIDSINVHTPLNKVIETFHSDWQPIAGDTGANQFVELERLLDEQSRSWPNVAAMNILGDIVHRAGMGSGEVNFLRAANFPGAAAFKPGDPYPWGLEKVFNSIYNATKIGKDNIYTLRGNHDLWARYHADNPGAWTFIGSEKSLGPAAYWRRRGNLAFLYLGTEGGGVGGQISRTTIEWADEVLTRNPHYHWHIMLHQPILGYGPLTTHITNKTAVTLTAAQIAAINNKQEVEVTIPAYWDESEITTPIFLTSVNGRLLEHNVDYVYQSAFDPDLEVEGDDDANTGSSGNSPTTPTLTKIKFLKTFSKGPLAAGTKIQSREITGADSSLDPWTSHLLLGTTGEPGLIRRHMTKIFAIGFGHTGDPLNKAHRTTWKDTALNIVFFSNHMILNSRVKNASVGTKAVYGTAQPLIYSVAEWTASSKNGSTVTPGKLVFRRWNATASVNTTTGVMTGNYLSVTHPTLANLDFTITYPGIVDLGDGRVFDSRRDDLEHLMPRHIFFGRNIAEAEGRQTPTGTMTSGGFPAYNTAAGGLQTILTMDSMDTSGKNSVPMDGFRWVFKSARGNSPGRGFSYKQDPSLETLRFNFRRSRDSEFLARGVYEIEGLDPNFEWKTLLKADGESGIVDIPNMGITTFTSANTSSGNAPTTPTSINVFQWVERDKIDIGAGEGQNLRWDVKLFDWPVAKPIYSLGTVKRGSSDTAIDFSFEFNASSNGTDPLTNVWTVNATSQTMTFAYGVNLSGGIILPTRSSFDIYHTYLNSTQVPEGMHIVQNLIAKEGVIDLQINDERASLWSSQLISDPAPVPLWGWSSRRISGADTVRTEEPALLVSPNGDGVLEKVFIANPSKKEVQFNWPIVEPLNSIYEGVGNIYFPLNSPESIPAHAAALAPTSIVEAGSKEATVLRVTSHQTAATYLYPIAPTIWREDTNKSRVSVSGPVSFLVKMRYKKDSPLGTIGVRSQLYGPTVNLLEYPTVTSSAVGEEWVETEFITNHNVFGGKSYCLNIVLTNVPVGTHVFFDYIKVIPLKGFNMSRKLEQFKTSIEARLAALEA